MLKFWREWQRPVEFALLLLLVFFLPLREAPKNIFWVLYVVTWMVNRARARDFGGPWNGWDTLFVFWLVSAWLAAAFTGIHRGGASEWLAVNDLVRYISIGWCVARARYGARDSVTVLAALVGSCVITEIEGLWNWKITHLTETLHLYSVGQVNHSAIYMTICLGIDAALALAYWRTASPRMRAAMALAGLLMLVGLFLTGSRAAAGVAVLLLCLLPATGAAAAGLGRKAWAGALAVIALAFAIGGTAAVQRQIDNAAIDNIMTARDTIWARGMVAWRVYPVFGVGPDNFSQIDDNRLRTWLAAEGKQYDPRDYFPAPHAHNLFINTLVERGVVGLAGLLAVFVAWAWLLLRQRPRPGMARQDLALWSASFSGWLVTVSIGLVNTTLHHEHAILALLTLGLWLPFARAAQTRQT